MATMEMRITNGEERSRELNKVYIKKLDKIEQKQDITNEKLTLDEKIVEIESKIVDVFLREYEEQSIHDFLKEKIIEKVLID